MDCTIASGAAKNITLELYFTAFWLRVRELRQKLRVGRRFKGRRCVSPILWFFAENLQVLHLGKLSFLSPLSNEPMGHSFGPKMTPKRPKHLLRLPADFSRPVTHLSPPSQSQASTSPSMYGTHVKSTWKPRIFDIHHSLVHNWYRWLKSAYATPHLLFARHVGPASLFVTPSASDFFDTPLHVKLP